MKIANVGIFKDETALNQKLVAMLSELMFLFNVAFWSYQRHRMEFKDKNRRCDMGAEARGLVTGQIVISCPPYAR